MGITPMNELRSVTPVALRYQRMDRIANRLGAHLMYDCHLFRRANGSTVREVAADWQQERDVPDECYGEPMLCPVIVLDGTKELRRVGTMVHPGSEKEGEQLKRWIEECEADPDIPRLLAAGRNCSE